MVTIIDVDGAILGRICTNVAKRLLDGEEIAIINSEKVLITGKKFAVKNEYKKKRELGTYRKGPFFPRMPDKLLKRSVRGMIPYQTPHGRAAYKKLKCYIKSPCERSINHKIPGNSCKSACVLVGITGSLNSSPTWSMSWRYTSPMKTGRSPRNPSTSQRPSCPR